MEPNTVSHFRGTLAYNGQRYQGFQRQAVGTLTIQGTVETAIERVTRQLVTVNGAGRTDTGVHARGQVIAFHCKWHHPTEALWRAINANLPRDIVLVDLSLASADFHPRYDALSRRYCYQFYTAKAHDPLWDMTAWHVGQQLDRLAMQAAADLLLGCHDFATFGQPTQGEITIRRMLEARHIQGEDGIDRFYFEANGFLKHMVRSLMGTLVAVGREQMTREEFGAALAAADRRLARRTAPPHGLILMSVKYKTGESEQHASQNMDCERVRY